MSSSQLQRSLNANNDYDLIKCPHETCTFSADSKNKIFQHLRTIHNDIITEDDENDDNLVECTKHVNNDTTVNADADDSDENQKLFADTQVKNNDDEHSSDISEIDEDDEIDDLDNQDEDHSYDNNLNDYSEDDDLVDDYEESENKNNDDLSHDSHEQIFRDDILDDNSKHSNEADDDDNLSYNDHHSTLSLQEIEEEDANNNQENEFQYQRNPLENVFRGLPGQHFVPPEDVVTGFLYTNDQVVELLLCNVMKKISAPLSGWRMIMRWAAYAQRLQYDFQKFHTREHFLEQLAKQFNMQDMKPLCTQAPIDLSPCKNAPKTADVIHFDIQTAIKSLLTDPLNRNRNNCVINDADPFGKYIPPDPEVIGEALGGNVYQDNYENFIPDDPNQNYLVFPIVVFTDATHADRFGNFKVHPVLIASTFHSLRVRRLAAGWRLIGLIPSIYHNYSKADRERMNEKNKGYAVRNLHSMLDVIFAPLVKIQQEGGFIMKELTINNVTRHDVLIITPIHYVMGDMEGNDALAGKTRKKVHISRACHCPYNKADDTNHVCKWKTKSEVIKIMEKETTFKKQLEACNTISQTPVDNAFYKLQFMHDLGNIHLSTPICMMHLGLQGLFLYTGDNIIEPFGKNEQSRLDGLVRSLLPSLRQSGVKNGFPRCQFANGLTNLSQITADEREGTIFLFVLLFSIPSLHQNIEENIFAEFKDRFPDASPRQNRKNYLLVCELLLITYAFASEEIMCSSFVKKEAQKRLRHVLKTVKTYAPRTDGEGWNIPKFHEMLHCIEYTLMFGVPSQFNCACNEHHHIEITKRTAARTSFIHDCFEYQVGQRYYEDSLVTQMTSLFSSCHIFDNDIYDLHGVNPKQGVGGIKRHKIYEPDESSSKGATTLYVRFNKRNNFGSNKIAWDPIIVQKKDKKTLLDVTKEYDPAAIAYLVDRYFIYNEDSDDPPECNYEKFPNFRLRTEYRKSGVDGKATILRCHPNYRGGFELSDSKKPKPWFDWCEILYETEANDDHHNQEHSNGLLPTTGQYYPSRLSFIIEYQDVNTNKLTTYVIAEVANKIVEMESLLTGSFKLDSFPGSKRKTGGITRLRKRKYYNVTMDAVSDTCFCIPSYPDDPEKWDHITYVLPMQRWAGIFSGKWRSSDDDDREETGIRIDKNGLLKCIF